MNEATESGAKEPFQGPTGERQAQAPLGPTLWYCLANLGYGMFYAFNNASLTLYLQRFTHSNVLLGLMGSSHSIEGAVIQPIVGSASDNLRTRMGRRRPFMLIFTPISVLFLLLTPAASHLPVSARLMALVACIFLFTVSFNIAQDPYQSLMADLFPKNQRGRVTGIWMFIMVVGQASLILMKLPVDKQFELVAVVMLITTGLTLVMTREPAHPEIVRKPGHLAELREALDGLKILKQARRALIGLFLSGIGIGAILPFLTLFVKKITHCSDQSAGQMFLILMATTALGVLPFGWMSDRVGSKPILILGMGLIGIAAINGVWVTSLTQISIVMAVAGLGNAAQSAAAYPLLTRVVPGEEVGFYTGLQSTALSIAQPLTAVITGRLVDQGGYRWIFVVCGISISLSLFVLATVRMDRAVVEVAGRDRQQGRIAEEEEAVDGK